MQKCSFLHQNDKIPFALNSHELFHPINNRISFHPVIRHTPTVFLLSDLILLFHPSFIGNYLNISMHCTVEIKNRSPKIDFLFIKNSIDIKTKFGFNIFFLYLVVTHSIFHIFCIISEILKYFTLFLIPNQSNLRFFCLFKTKILTFWFYRITINSEGGANYEKII